MNSWERIKWPMMLRQRQMHLAGDPVHSRARLQHGRRLRLPPLRRPEDHRQSGPADRPQLARRGLSRAPTRRAQSIGLAGTFSCAGPDQDANCGDCGFGAIWGAMQHFRPKTLRCRLETIGFSPCEGLISHLQRDCGVREGRVSRRGKSTGARGTINPPNL